MYNKEKGNRFATADLHYGHENIIKYCDRFFCLSDYEKDEIAKIKRDFPGNQRAVRDFRISRESVDNMDKIIINNINEDVKENDILYILGDFCWAKTFDKVVDFRSRIRCRNLILIKGNHDEFSYREYSTIFNEVLDYKEVRHNGTHITMCHYPMYSYNSMNRGGVMLHGHNHGNSNQWKKEHLPGHPIIDVGIDSWNYRPATFETLLLTAEKIRNEVQIVRYPDIPANKENNVR